MRIWRDDRGKGLDLELLRAVCCVLSAEIEKSWLLAVGFAEWGTKKRNQSAVEERSAEC